MACWRTISLLQGPRVGRRDLRPSHGPAELGSHALLQRSETKWLMRVAGRGSDARLMSAREAQASAASTSDRSAVGVGVAPGVGLGATGGTVGEADAGAGSGDRSTVGPGESAVACVLGVAAVGPGVEETGPHAATSRAIDSAAMCRMRPPFTCRLPAVAAIRRRSAGDRVGQHLSQSCAHATRQGNALATLSDQQRAAHAESVVLGV